MLSGLTLSSAVPPQLPTPRHLPSALLCSRPRQPHRPLGTHLPTESNLHEEHWLAGQGSGSGLLWACQLTLSPARTSKRDPEAVGGGDDSGWATASQPVSAGLGKGQPLYSGNSRCPAEAWEELWGDCPYSLVTAPSSRKNDSTAALRLSCLPSSASCRELKGKDPQLP